MRGKKESLVLEIIILSFATLITSAAIYFFMLPSHVVVSSVSALAQIIQFYVPLPVSVLTMIMNVILLILGFLTCGKEFGAKTVYTSILTPIYLAIFEHFFPDFPSFTGSDWLDIVCYIFLVSIGMMILFNRNASSGGLDIAAKIVNKYTRMELGKAVSLIGILAALTSALVYDKRIVVLSILGTYLNGLILDHFIFGQNIKRRICILSKDHEKELLDFIMNELHSGATLYETIGAYTGEKHTEIIVIVNKQEYQKLMTYIEKNDPEAFVTVYNVNSIRYVAKTMKGEKRTV